MIPIKRRIKESIPIRLLASPYMMVKKYLENQRYDNSKYPSEIKKYKNRHKGGRCFILGNGPSLQVKDLELINEEICFAGNRIFDIFPKTDWRPDYYFCVDKNAVYQLNSEIERMNNITRFIEFSGRKAINNSDDIIYINSNPFFRINLFNDSKTGISEKPEHMFWYGYTVVYPMIQMALYMGMKEIYLLGVDFNYSTVIGKFGNVKHKNNVQDYFSNRKDNNAFLNYHSVLYSYECARNYCEKHNIKIRNCTRGGKLEVFIRESLEDVISSNQ